MIEDTTIANGAPFLIFSLLNMTPLNNNSSAIGAMKTAAINPKNKVKGSVKPVPAAIRKLGGSIVKTKPALTQRFTKIVQKIKLIIARATILKALPNSKTLFTSFVNPLVPMQAMAKNPIMHKSKIIVKNSSF